MKIISTIRYKFVQNKRTAYFTSYAKRRELFVILSINVGTLLQQELDNFVTIIILLRVMLDWIVEEEKKTQTQEEEKQQQIRTKAAIESEVCPMLFTWSMLAPLASSNSTISKWPFWFINQDCELNLKKEEKTYLRSCPKRSCAFIVCSINFSSFLKKKLGDTQMPFLQIIRYDRLCNNKKYIN